MARNSEFFGEKRAKAFLKHGVLTRYAYYFAGRAGKATGGRVAFVDGYAGVGRYEDGSPGSPLLLASQAEQARLFGRDIKLIFVEPNPSIMSRLRSTLDISGVNPDQLIEEDLGSVANSIISQLGSRATLLFVDPFGLAIDRPRLINLLNESSPRRPVDVLYHFSISSVARMGRAALGTTPSAGRNAEKLDATFGVVDWRVRFTDAHDDGEPTAAAIGVARHFAEDVAAETGVSWTAVPVRERPTQLPKYLLILFSRDRSAHWDFVDQAGMAYAEWLLHCDKADYDANISGQASSGVLTLFDDPQPEMAQIESSIDELAARYFAEYLPTLFAERGSVRMLDNIEPAYGHQFGRARVKHLRAALKALHDAGVIDDDAKGAFWMRTITGTKGGD